MLCYFSSISPMTHNVLKMVFIARIGRKISLFFGNIYKYTTILVIKVKNKLAKK